VDGPGDVLNPDELSGWPVAGSGVLKTEEFRAADVMPPTKLSGWLFEKTGGVLAAEGLSDCCTWLGDVARTAELSR
jgi:hypothetical protein